jgi:putative membrane protein
MMEYYGFGPMWNGFGIVGAILGLGMMLLVWAALILLVVWLVRTLSGPRRGQQSAGEVLDRRLAAGEITPEEHARIRQTLRS